jgi:signal transduction histidine kinase
VQGVQDVSDQLRGISTASTQQSTGLEEVTRSVGDLDAITQENAAMVEQSHSAAQTLMERAEALRTAVSSMRLRHGSADEALGMVEKAVAHLQNVGRAQALQDFHRAETGFIDRDLYLFAFDRHFLFSVNGSDPGLVGKHVDSVPGLAHTRFAEDAWAMAQNGGGWVRYEVISPLSGQIMPKESYVLALSADELIGCGCYQGHSGR